MKKQFLGLLLVLVLMSCTSKKTEEVSTSDTLQPVDTTKVDSVSVDSSSINPSKPDSVTTK